MFNAVHALMQHTYTANVEKVAMAKCGAAVELHVLQFCCMRQTVCCSTEDCP